MSRTHIRRHDTVSSQLVLADGDSLIIANGGELHVGGRQSALMLVGGVALIRNSGVIQSDDGIAVNGRLSGSVSLVIRNDGLIAGGSIGIGVASDEGTAGSVIIRNAGSIVASGYAAIDHSFVHLDQTILVNNGDLNGPQAGSSSALLAFMGSDGRDILLNHGTIHGQVSLGGGDDVFRDTGLNDGTLQVIIGGDGDDRISGGAGPDLIVGGAGRDIVRGGAGADIFGYTDLSDSSADGADHILRFNVSGGDVIDLSQIDADKSQLGDQAFSLIGSNAFSGRPGELRCDLLHDGGAVVYADVNGDAVADFKLVVRGEVYVPEDLHLIF